MASIPKLHPALEREGFYNRRKAVGKNKGTKAGWYNVGGHGDNHFRAVAAGFIDLILAKRRVNKTTLQAILDKHFHCFPEHRSTLAGLVTPGEHMRQLVYELDMPELVQTLAYSFRQLAVAELVRHPAKYADCFLNLPDDYPLQKMLHPTEPLGLHAIAALAHTIGQPVKLYEVEQDKPLPRVMHFYSAPTLPEIVVQYQQGYCIPWLVHTSQFSRVAIKAIQFTPVDTGAVIPERQAIDDRIAIAHTAMYDTYVTMQDRLMAMLNAGELKQEHLFALYGKVLRCQEHPLPLNSIEHGTQQHFATVKPVAQGQAIEFTAPSSAVYLAHGLVNAVARAVSCGQITEDAVFDDLDMQVMANGNLNRSAAAD